LRAACLAQAALFLFAIISPATLPRSPAGRYLARIEGQERRHA